MKVNSKAFAQAAIDALALGITYTQEDCQAFVEATIKRAGGSMPNYRGSNDMFRNACDSVHPLDISIREGLIAPGCVLFIVEDDGGEPAQYREDGLGNASHIGIYTGGTPEVVHSSASKGGVVASTLRNGWTHAGWLSAVDYVHEDAPDIPTPTAEVVAVSGGTVRMRVRPDRAAMASAKVPVGSIVNVLTQEPEWWQIWYNGKVGWMMREFLRLTDEAVPGAPSVDITALLDEAEGHITRLSAVIKALREVSDS